MSFHGQERLLTEQLTDSGYTRTLSYQVDQAGNRTRITWPDSLYVQYAYDAVNRATTVYENGSTHLGTYSYDTLGRRATLSRGNGASTTFSYDSASRLSGLAHDLASTGNDQTFTLSPYNPASQLLARTATNNAYAWSQPAVSATYVRNGLNQYTSVGGISYSYSDGRGNLTSDGSRTFAYDVENRLTSVGGSASLTLTYDPLGRLKHVTGGSTTQFLYDGDRLSAEYNTSGTVLRRYVHGPGVDEPLVWYEGSSTSDRRWLHSDERGSVIAHSDGSGVGTLYKYGSYGEPDSWTGPRFRYTGQIMLQGSGVELYHYKARVYDPKIGRFLQTDPIGYDDNLNMYAYVGGNPIGNVDPTGTYSCGRSLISFGGCRGFLDDQERAKKQISSSMDTIRSLQSKLGSGKKLSAAEKAMSGVIDKVLGAGGGSDSKVLGALLDVASKMLGELNSNKPAEYGGESASGYAADASHPGQLMLYSGFFGKGEPGRMQTLAHESHHHGTGSVDYTSSFRSSNGAVERVSAYGYPNAVRRAQLNGDPLKNMELPDPVTFVLGFSRD